MKRKTQEEFIAIVAERNNKVSIIGEYKGSANKVLTKCNSCGYEWMASPKNLYTGCGCPKCYGTPKKTHTQFLIEMHEKHPEIEVLDSYIDAKTPIKFKCLNCEHVWRAKPNNILKGSRCPKCYGTPKKTSELYAKQFYDNNNSIILLSEYETNKKKISVRCKVCSFEWLVRPSDMIRVDGRKTGCPACAGNQKKTQNEFIKILKEKNPKVNVVGQYNGRHKEIRVSCKNCEYIWSAKAVSLLRGAGCPKCMSGYQSSYFEQCLLLSLRKIYGEDSVIHRDVSLIGSELDIYIPKLKLAFEPGGWFWHKDKIEADVLKQKKCAEVGVKLLTIYDDVDYTIEKIPIEGFWLLIHEDIGNKRNDIDLLYCVLENVYKKAGIEFKFNKEDIKSLRVDAEMAVRKRTTTDFIEMMQIKNPKIKILSEYRSSRSKIKVECQRCGHIWEAEAGSLIAGHGCPKCYGTPKKTTESFVQELERVNPEIMVVGEYTGARNKIFVRCKKCGNEWQPAAGSLLCGHGCPRKRYHG